jgi:peptidoglycan/xylan/chitin deacetylase (PgdA/CDA1 family)
MRNFILQTIKSALGHAECLIQPWRYSSDECIVLCMHSTPGPFLHRLSQLVVQLRKNFTIIGPKEFEKYLAGELHDGPYLLFSFDDGLRNNFKAAQLLNELNVHAYFFIVPHFVQSLQQKKYYLDHIRPIVDPNFEKDPIDFEAMSVDELKEIIQWGHAIGSHTLTHDLRADLPFDVQQDEVLASKVWLEKELGQPITAFCSPNNTNYSVSKDGAQLIHQHYEYHFTTFPGLHVGHRDKQMILRRNIEVNWSLGRIRYALGKWDLKRWTNAINEYRMRAQRN